MEKVRNKRNLTMKDIPEHLRLYDLSQKELIEENGGVVMIYYVFVLIYVSLLQKRYY